MDIVKEYKRVLEDIAVSESILDSVGRDLERAINIYRPSDVKGVDYTKELITGSIYQQDIFITAEDIAELKLEKSKWKKELKELKKQQKRLDSIINDLGDIKKEIAIGKVKGKKDKELAEEYGYSERHIRRITKEIKHVL